MYEYNIEQENKKSEQERKAQQKQSNKQKNVNSVAGYKKKNKGKKGDLYKSLSKSDKPAPFISADERKDGNK